MIAYLDTIWSHNGKNCDLRFGIEVLSREDIPGVFKRFSSSLEKVNVQLFIIIRPYIQIQRLILHPILSDCMMNVLGRAVIERENIILQYQLSLIKDLVLSLIIQNILLINLIHVHRLYWSEKCQWIFSPQLFC